MLQASPSCERTLAPCVGQLSHCLNILNIASMEASRYLKLAVQLHLHFDIIPRKANLKSTRFYEKVGNLLEVRSKQRRVCQARHHINVTTLQEHRLQGLDASVRNTNQGALKDATLIHVSLCCLAFPANPQIVSNHNTKINVSKPK